ncbi:glycosyltransferase family 4 protein [Halobacteriovorax sp.]|uniref:glycosyltransferase family 4 protein n=1 Tax=Halobacteriovorax sp. TaxID=2020862 RepID=UPI003AF1EA5F
MSKKITYFTPFGSDSSTACGVRAKYFIAELEKDYEVKEVFVDKNPSYFFSLPSNKESSLKRLFKEFLVGVEASIRFFFSKSDLYILSSPSYIIVFLISFTLRLKRAKYILDIRDIYPEVYFHLGLIRENSLIGKVLKFLTKQMYKRAIGVTTATKGLEKIFLSYRVKTPVKTILNGFDNTKFFPVANKGTTFTVLFHGTLAKMQNIDLLVKVAESLPESIEVVVAGEGPQEDKVKNSSRIKYLKNIDYNNVNDLVNSVNLGLSFRNDGLINMTSFPVKVFEYIGAGIPVITTPISEAGTFLEENKLGFQFTNDNVEKIVDKIIELVNIDCWPYRRELISPLSRQFQAKEFSNFVKLIFPI